jgi:hypothetical protein
MQGSIDSAIELDETAIEMAREIKHPFSLCCCLVFPATTLFLKLGESTEPRGMSRSSSIRRAGMGSIWSA